MGANTYSYGYDPIGNRITATNNAEAFSYFANALNQYTNISGGVALAPAYDLDGNMLTNGPWAYTWDAENRMTSATSNNVLLVANTYDHQSRRIRKEFSRRGAETQSWELERTHTFLYDGWNPVRETVAAGGSVATNYYTWGLDLSGTLQGAGGVGGLLAVTRGDGSVYYPCYDANGNVTAYVDSTGATAATLEYDAFGNTVAETVDAGLHLPFRFSTKYLDPEAGLYYYGYRFYHPELGRWANRDPIGERGGNNLYMNCRNELFNKFDSLGERAYLVYRPFNDWLLYWAYPLVGHYYLAFDDKFRGGIADALKWERAVRAANVNHVGFAYRPLMTFSFHPQSVDAKALKVAPKDAGARVSTFVTKGSLVAVNDEVDLDGFKNASKWFGFGKGRTDELSDDVCKQIHLFNAAVHSTNLNNLGWPDPGDYQVLNRNCGTWAQLMINRAGLAFPLPESVIGNFGGGIGGLNDLTKFGDVTTFTLRSIYEMGERLESFFGL